MIPLWIYIATVALFVIAVFWQGYLIKKQFESIGGLSAEISLYARMLGVYRILFGVLSDEQLKQAELLAQAEEAKK
jgi:hypothetical protein